LQDRRIFAEHGIEHTADELIAHTAPLPPNRRAHIPNPRHERGEWVERGVLFVRYDFC
jgi:hypothetical protein